MKIETEAKTLGDLAIWILSQPELLQSRHLSIYDDGEILPWNGVIYDEEGDVYLSPVITQAQGDVIRRQREAEEAERRQQHWSRPEVLDAKEKGLLP